jgi:hypothetical protein
MDQMGARMQERAAREVAGVSATIGPGPVMTVRAAQAARVPITGAYAPGAEVYGAVTISRVDVPAGGEVTVPLAPPPGDDGGTDGPVVVAADAGHQILVSVGAATGGCGCALPPTAPGRGAWLALGLAAIATASAAARSSAHGRRRRRFSAPRTGPETGRDARRWWRAAPARRPPS